MSYANFSISIHFNRKISITRIFILSLIMSLIQTISTKVFKPIINLFNDFNNSIIIDFYTFQVTL